MITVYGEGRGFRVVWLLEELGIEYKLRPVDLLADLRDDPEFLAVNPGGFIPAIQDGDVVMVESIAIMEYLLARYGPSPLAPKPSDATYPMYQQFLHLGEAGLAVPANAVFVSRHLAPDDERDNFLTRWALQTFKSRLGLVRRQLERTPYLAGDDFTAADISVTYALEMASRHATLDCGPIERDYIARTTSRPAYQRAMASCHATRQWVESHAARVAATRGANSANDVGDDTR